MKTKLLVSLFMSLMVFPFLSFGQIKPIKSQILGNTCWCAEVEDILFSNEPQQEQKLAVGVRVKLTKKTIIPGAPRQKLCDCAFEGPSSAPAKSWSKTMSLRLIGIKYSETETNFLEYYGPSSAFPPYDYSGFSVMGFVVTENDLKKGYIDVWGWASKEPLQCRDATIYASFAVYNQSPYNQQNECHPHSDFKKSFKPKCLQAPKIPERAVKEGVKKAIVRIPPDKLPPVVLNLNKFVINKKTAKVHIPFTDVDFKKEGIRIAADTDVTLQNGTKINGAEFLKEVNEIEKKLNEWGYSLRDKEEEITIQHFIIPLNSYKLQKTAFQNITPQIPGTPEETTPPKEFHPFNWEKSWTLPLGNDDFGAYLSSNLKLFGTENEVSTKGRIDASTTIFGNTANLLTVEVNVSGDRSESKGNVNLYVLDDKKESFSLPASYKNSLEYSFDTDWSFDLSMPIGPIDVTGELGFKGEVGANLAFNLNLLDSYASVSSFMDTKAYATLGAGYKIVEVGVGGDLILLQDKLVLLGSLALVNTDDIQNAYFKTRAYGNNEINALCGSLYIYGKIDYLFGSKKFKVELYNWDGFNWNKNLFDLSTNEPTYRDKELYLYIDRIRGITSYSARNEKNGINPKSFTILVEAGGKTFSKTILAYRLYPVGTPEKDMKDAGDVEPYIYFKIPLSSKITTVPIKITILENYSTGTLDLVSTLDLSKGEREEFIIYYDVTNNTYSGDVSGKLEERKTTTGDSHYFGERYHSMIFEFSPALKFKGAPAQTK